MSLLGQPEKQHDAMDAGIKELRVDKNLSLYKNTPAVKAIEREWNAHARAIIKFNSFTTDWQRRLVDFATRVRKLDIDESQL